MNMVDYYTERLMWSVPEELEETFCKLIDEIREETETVQGVVLKVKCLVLAYCKFNPFGQD